MARNSGHPIIICIMCTLIAIAGGAAGIYYHKPLVAVIALLPAAAYEAYRTEGISTIWASWGMIAILVAELILLIWHININVASYAAKYIPNLPVIDLKLAGPILMAYFSYILIRWTAGIYTKWLAAVILLGCIALFYSLDPSLFGRFAERGIEEGIKKLPLQ